MEDKGLVAISQGWLAYLPLGLPIGITALFIWVIWRTESWHLLRRRIWQVTHGRGDITDAGIRKFVEEQTNLAAFRIFVGPSVNRLQDAHKLMEWCQARNVDLGALRMCGDHFDAESRRVKTGDQYLSLARYFWGINAIFFLLTGLISLYLIVAPHVLLSIKASGQHFLASETSIRVAWPLVGGQKMSVKDCERPTDAAERLQFSNEDVAILCDLIGAPKYKAYIGDALRTQRMSLFGLGIILLGAMYFCAVGFLQSACARKLLRRAPDPSLPAAQLELDFGSRH